MISSSLKSNSLSIYQENNVLIASTPITIDRNVRCISFPPPMSISSLCFVSIPPGRATGVRW